jgi:hypothetical protein
MRSIHSFEEVKKLIVVILVAASCLSVAEGQTPKKYNINGQLTDKNSNQAVQFATVALRRLPDSLLITGILSDGYGKFSFGSLAEGRYQLIISAIGYSGEARNINLVNDCETGIIYLQEKAVSLKEVVISSERKKAEAGAEQTTYFINKKLNDASNTGADLLGYIPGVQLDLMKNISLRGSSNIVILVDGKEREKDFLSQLDPRRIDKVEVTDGPDARYDAGITGVINIILKKDRESGMNGYINLEAPSSASEIYLHPSYNFNYGLRKLNFYTSWNGELTYLNLLESSKRIFRTDAGTTDITSVQDLRQKNWSHRFHYGLDYNLNEKNLISFYSFYNPWSRELDGSVAMNVSGDNTGEKQLTGFKDDTDINSASYYSVYYRHDFRKPGRRIEFDLGRYRFRAENSTAISFSSDEETTNTVNRIEPDQNQTIIKIDYTSPVTEKLKINAGIKTRLQLMQDRLQPGFRYRENVYAAYLSAIYNLSKYTLKTGFRAEKSSAGIPGSFNNDVFVLLPDLTINYKLSSGQNIKLSYNRTVNRADLYELNPYTSFDDPFSSKSGNPYLKPDFLQNLNLGYSYSHGDNFISALLYYRKRSDAINSFTILNEAGLFESNVANLGNIRAYGMEMTGSLKLLKIVTVNPYFSLYNMLTGGNDVAVKNLINDRQKVSFETGISAIAGFKYDITASLQIQYKSPVTDLQVVSFSDPLYFISLEKSFLKKYKVGIKSALAFPRTFTYQGSEIEGLDFTNRSEGNVMLSRLPLWFSFRYQFNSGRKINKVERDKEEISSKQKKGF